MRHSFVVILLVTALVTTMLAGCASQQLAKAAMPNRLLIAAPRACAGAALSDPSVREFCLELAKLEAHRAEAAAQAAASAQAAQSVVMVDPTNYAGGYAVTTGGSYPYRQHRSYRRAMSPSGYTNPQAAATTGSNPYAIGTGQ